MNHIFLDKKCKKVLVFTKAMLTKYQNKDKTQLLAAVLYNHSNEKWLSSCDFQIIYFFEIIPGPKIWKKRTARVNDAIIYSS